MNCGATLIPHRAGGHAVMCLRPVAGRPDYVVAIDGVEVHRCGGGSISMTRDRLGRWWL